MVTKLESPPKFTEMLKPKAPKVPEAPRGTWAQQHQGEKPGMKWAGPAARATAAMQKATPASVGRPIEASSAFANNPNPKFANAPAPAPAPTVTGAAAPEIDAPIAPAGSIAPPPPPDAGFMQRVEAAMPAAQKRHGYNMATGEIAPPPSKGVAGPVGPAGQQPTPADGMKSVADYNRRMAIPQRKPDQAFGTGMNGESPMLSKPFGTGMNGESPIVARAQRRPAGVPISPAPESESMYGNRMASMLKGQSAGMEQPQAALMTEPPIETAPRDPFFAKLESNLKGSKVLPGGRRGARRGPTVKGGRNHGLMLDEVMDRVRRGTI